MNKKEIKSYVIRSRMTPLQKQSYDKFYSKYCIDYKEEFIEYKNYFAENINDVIVEIGFGMGDATVQIAESNKDNGYIAIEVHKPGIGKLINEIENKKLNNIKIIEYDAVKVLSLMTKDDYLKGIHIFFPDPWPKNKHHKRRLINSNFVKLIASKIKTGGYLFITTDWQDYADDIMSVLDKSENFKNAYDGFAHDISWRPLTKFEKKGLKKSHNIYEIYFEKI